MVWTIEKGVPGVEYNGLNTDKPVVFGHGTRATNATSSTVTLTAAQCHLGWITNTGSTVTMTLPTGTLLGAELTAAKGTCLELYVDNTAALGTVTIAAATNGVLSDAGNTTSGSFGQLTVAANATTGIGRFTIMFLSATAYTFTRTA